MFPISSTRWIERTDRDALGAVWDRLRILLEVDAEAEERHFYPCLLDVGTGGERCRRCRGRDDRDAISDHNDIRAAITADGARGGRNRHDDGNTSQVQARVANSDHMGEEEREALADFRRQATLQVRHDLGLAFATFETQHAGGIRAQDLDVDDYIEKSNEA